MVLDESPEIQHDSVAKRSCNFDKVTRSNSYSGLIILFIPDNDDVLWYAENKSIILLKRYPLNYLAYDNFYSSCPFSTR